MPDALSQRVSTGDLIENQFGHIVSIDTAEKIVLGLLKSGALQVYKKSKNPLGPAGFLSAAKLAADLATEAFAKSPKKKKKLQDVYTWKWSNLQPKPGDEIAAVAFLNAVSMSSYAMIQQTDDATLHGRTPTYRFAYNPYRHHRLPLAEPCESIDGHPDFLLLPAEAWSQDEQANFIHDDSLYESWQESPIDSSPPDPHTDDFSEHPQEDNGDAKDEDTVGGEELAEGGGFRDADADENDAMNVETDSDVLNSPSQSPATWRDSLQGQDKREWLNLRHVNWRMNAMGGECKFSDVPTATRQCHWYMRLLRRCQPWLRFSTGLAITSQKLIVLRGDASGVEECVLSLESTRGVIDTIRACLGLILSTDEDLGRNESFALETIVIPENDFESPTILEGKKRNASNSDANLPSRYPKRMRKMDAETTLAQPESDSKSIADSEPSTHTQSDDISWQPEGSQRMPDKNVVQDPPFPGSYLAQKIARYTRGSESYEVHDLVFRSGSVYGRNTCVWKVSLKTKPDVMLALKLSWLDRNRACQIQDVYQQIKADNVRKFLLPNIM